MALTAILEQKSPKRLGGARPSAGRPKLTEKRTKIAFRVSDERRAQLQEIADIGQCSLSEAVGIALGTFFDNETMIDHMRDVVRDVVREELSRKPWL